MVPKGVNCILNLKFVSVIFIHKRLQVYPYTKI